MQNKKIDLKQTESALNNISEILKRFINLNCLQIYNSAKFIYFILPKLKQLNLTNPIKLSINSLK